MSSLNSAVSGTKLHLQCGLCK